MKIVLDTNVLMSGIFFSGPPYQILKSWQENKIQLVITEKILNEYQRVAKILSNKYPKIEIDNILGLIAIHTEIIDDSNHIVKICEDPDDDIFISCALSCGCKIIVSGDKHLLKISGYENIEVLKPRLFLEKYLK